MSSEIWICVTMHFLEMSQMIRKQSLNVMEWKEAIRIPGIFIWFAKKTFIKHALVENIVSFSVTYFLLEYNIMKHMPIDYQAQWQFPCDLMTEKVVTLHVHNKQLRKHHRTTKLTFKNWCAGVFYFNSGSVTVKYIMYL